MFPLMILHIRQNPSLQWAQLTVVVVAMTLWWPNFVTEFGMMDDYAFLAFWSHPDFSLWTSDVVRMGRPLAAILERMQFLAFDQVADLASVRLLSAAALMLFGVLLLRGLVEAGWSLFKSLGITLLVLTTPPFVVYVGWAAMCNASLAAVPALWGSQLYLSRWVWNPTPPSRRRWITIGGSLAMILIAACLYQPIACLFLLLPLATVFNGSIDLNQKWRSLSGSIVLFLVGLGIYFISFLGAKQFVFKSDYATHRSNLVADIGEKLAFLWHQPIIDLLGFWTTLMKADRPQGIWVYSLCVTVIALAGLFVRHRSSWAPLFAFGFVLAVIGLTFAPLALVAENSAPFRTLGAPYGAWVILLVGGLSAWLPHPRWRRSGWLLLTIFTIYSTQQAWVAMREGIVDHQRRELAVLRNLLNESIGFETRAVIFRMPFFWNNSTRIRNYQEFAVSSTTTIWGAECLVQTHIRETCALSPEHWLTVFCEYPWESLHLCDLPVVDAYRALTGDEGTPQPVWVWKQNAHEVLQYPPFGTVSCRGFDWIYHERFGYARVIDMPEIDTTTHPPTVRTPPSGAISFFLLCEGRFFRTTEDEFPLIIDQETHRRYLLEEGRTGHPRLTLQPIDTP